MWDAALKSGYQCLMWPTHTVVQLQCESSTFVKLLQGHKLLNQVYCIRRTLDIYIQRWPRVRVDCPCAAIRSTCSPNLLPAASMEQWPTIGFDCIVAQVNCRYLGYIAAGFFHHPLVFPNLHQKTRPRMVS